MSVSLVLIILACNQSGSLEAQNTMERTSEFDEYWFQSTAEITGYKLEQVRYNDVHEGQAVLIFVTEPFNTQKHVKSDNGVGRNVQSAMKLNHVRRFNTGIYPYNIMTSSFTPVSQTGYGKTFKVSSSMQEWCGHVYTQYTKKGNQFDVNSYSYFESEGDHSFQVKEALLEDEIMSLIRINPEIIKEGETMIIPAAHYLRLIHKEMKPYKAKISKTNSTFDGQDVVVYEINIPELERKVTITTTKSFPYSIEEWTEEYPAIFTKEKMITRATKIKTMRLDYWNKHNKSDEALYQELFTGME